MNFTTAKKVLDNVIDNGRLSSQPSKEELMAEIEFECLEQGIQKDEISDYIEWAISHTKLD